jgi:O-antigen/teichoic acid export membrane protein
VAQRDTPSLARNTVAQALPRLAGYILSFLSAPIIVSGLGLRNFGIWALTGALAQYGALLDLGVGVSLARYIAAHTDDRESCGQYMAIGFGAVIAIGALLGAAAMLGAPIVRGALHGISLAHMRLVLGCSVVLLCCSMVSGVITAYPIGHRRMVVPNIANAIASAINFVASVGSIALGAGLPGYALANAGAGIVSIAVVWLMVVRVEGRLPVRAARWPVVRTFLAFSVKNQVIKMMDLVNYQTDKIVIAFSVGPAIAGAYELANRVALAVREVGIYAASAIDIEFTAMRALHGFDSVRQRYRRLLEVAVTFGYPPMLLTIASAPMLLDVWLSHAPPDSAGVLAALCSAYLLAVSTGVSYSVAVAAGEPGTVARASIGAAVANVLLTVALAPLFGVWGVLAGTVVALSGGAIAQITLVHRRYDLPAESYLAAVVPPLRTYALFAVPVAAFCWSSPLHGRVVEGAALIAVAAAYGVACGAWALRSGRLPGAVTSRLPAFVRLRPSA